MQIKKAFTLAEVLITVSIIGVVAAITISSVVRNTQKDVMKTQYKKVFNSLARAVEASKPELGFNLECFSWKYGAKVPAGASYVCDKYGTFSSGETKCTKAHYEKDGATVATPHKNGNYDKCKEVSDAVLSKLKVIKTCESKAYEQGCIPKYLGVDTVYKSKQNVTKENETSIDSDADLASSGCGNMKESKILNSNPAIVLADGTIVFGYYSWNSGILNYLFAVDINGKKAPNKWGYDLFTFRLSGTSPSDVTLSFKDFCGPVEAGGLTSEEMFAQAFGGKK